MTQHAHHLARAATVAALATAVVMGGVTTSPASAEDATVTAIGRFVYVDDGGNTRGIRNARVEMCDEEFPGCTHDGHRTDRRQRLLQPHRPGR